MSTLRRSLRSLRTTPGLVILTVAVLALGIGANVAIFSVVNEALIRPLPYRDPDTLVMLWERVPELTEGNLSATAPDYLDYRAQTRAFESIAAFEPKEINLAFAGQAERATGVRVTEPLFPLLGVEPLLGRWFTAEEDVFGGPRAAILDHSFWQGRFGGDPGALGKSILVDHVPYTVVGVMPRGFDFPPSMTRGFRPADVFLPMAFTPRSSRSAAIDSIRRSSRELDPVYLSRRRRPMWTAWPVSFTTPTSSRPAADSPCAERRPRCARKSSAESGPGSGFCKERSRFSS